MQLSEKQWAEIDAKVPKAVEIQSRLLLPPWKIALITGPNKSLDIATVCLCDASEVARGVTYALRQAYASLVGFHEEHPQSPRAIEACIRGKFFADDAALRLYAVGEHIANFIVAFLEIEEPTLEPCKEKYTSRAEAVGKYLMNEMPSNEITLAVKELLAEKNWEKARWYRNTWVHKQPPLIEGVGVVYERNGRWTKTEHTSTLGIGGGDKPQYTVDSLLEMVLSASQALMKLFGVLTEILFAHLQELVREINKSGKIIIKL